MIRLDLSDVTSFSNHRSGWSYCMSKLQPYHSRSGILFDSFLEKTFCWNVLSEYKGGSSVLPYKRPWVGVLHNPPNTPSWFDDYNSPHALLDKPLFRQSLNNCKAIVVLSEYLRHWLVKKIEVPVIAVKHPTEIPRNKWKPENFFSKDRKIVQIGYWLRNMESFLSLKHSNKYSKVWLPGAYDYAMQMLSIQEKHDRGFYENKYRWSSVQTLNHIPNKDYDELLSNSIVFLDLFDSSANNAVIEPMARNTPILINKIDPVVEYLGVDYPLYYDNIEHAHDLLKNDDLIYQAHLYLKSMNKEWISGTYFATNLLAKLEGALNDNMS